MRQIWCLVCVSLFSSVAAMADGIDDDVYVVLYQRRVQAAEAVKERYLAQKEYDQAHYEMIRRLAYSGATSREELNEATAKLHISQARITEGEVAVLEAKSLLQVAKARRTTGLDMPVCPTILQ